MHEGSVFTMFCLFVYLFVLILIDFLTDITTNLYYHSSVPASLCRIHRIL